MRIGEICLIVSLSLLLGCVPAAECKDYTKQSAYSHQKALKIPKMKLNLEKCFPELINERQQGKRAVPKLRGGAGGSHYGIMGIRGTGRGGGGKGKRHVGSGTIGHGGGGGSGSGYGRGVGGLGGLVGGNGAQGAMLSTVEGGQDQNEQAVSLKNRPPGYDDWGAEIYLSNDDTMSLSSAQRIIYAIDNFLPLPAEHIRPHELLNYFSFRTKSPDKENHFSVLAHIAASPKESQQFTLALSINGRPLSKANRRKAAVTWVLDRSGSMSDEGRLNYLKDGLNRMLKEMKKGDIASFVLFDHEVCVPIENYVAGRDDKKVVKKMIKLLGPRGSTDVHQGLVRGYRIADGSYQKSYSNRVILVTDALTNTGIVDENIISTISKYYDSRQIRLSGVGVGRNFNDSLLNRLTERGRGAYVFLGSKQEVDTVFGTRFISLIETTALDVHFKLHLPESLKMKFFHGEESSTLKKDVQAVHYFANTSQLFLSDLITRDGRLNMKDNIKLTIEYKDPETDSNMKEEHAFNLGTIHMDAYNIKKGRLITTWVSLLHEMAERPVPSSHPSRPDTWNDAKGWQICLDGLKDLARMSAGLRQDKEARQVTSLWNKYCARFRKPRNPLRHPVLSKR